MKAPMTIHNVDTCSDPLQCLLHKTIREGELLHLIARRLGIRPSALDTSDHELILLAILETLDHTPDDNQRSQR